MPRQPGSASISDLKPDPRNARKRTDRSASLIQESLQRFGAARSIVIDEDGRILAGNGTVEGAKAAGIEKVRIIETEGDEIVAVRRTGLTEEQKIGLALADNRTSDLSEWDALMLQRLSEEQDLAPWFDADELAELLPDVEQLDAEEHGDADAVPEPPAEPVTKPGDVWILGRHRVVCGDATSPTDWDKLQIARPAMVFSSPPYGVGGNAKLRDKYKRGAEYRKSLYAMHDDDPDEWPDLMRGWTNNALARTDCIVCNIQTLANNKRNLFAWSAEYVGHMVDVAIWDKGHGAPQMQRNVLTNSFEWLFILAPEENPSRALPLADFHGTEENIVRVGKGSREFADIHRATMPVELAEWAVVSAGPKADVVVDPFGGTGTTLIAAEKHNKSALLIELDPRYCDVIVKRWQQFTSKTATLEATGEPFPSDD